MAGFKDFFIPKETAFFEHLKAQVYLLEQATQKISLLSKPYSKKKFNIAKKSLFNIISKGDALLLLVTEELHQTFITPIDRDEIQTLSFNINRVMHGLKKILIYSDIYQIPGFGKALKPQISLLQQAMLHLVDIFENPICTKKNQVSITHIKEIENKADGLFQSALIQLFSSNSSAIEIMKKKELFEIIEETMDKTEYLANTVQNVLINHS